MKKGKENYLSKIDEIIDSSKKQTSIFNHQTQININIQNRLRNKVKQLLPPIGTIIVVDGKEYKIDDYLINVERPDFGVVYVREKEKNGEWFESGYGLLNPDPSNVWDFVKQE